MGPGGQLLVMPYIWTSYWRDTSACVCVSEVTGNQGTQLSVTGLDWVSKMNYWRKLQHVCVGLSTTNWSEWLWDLGACMSRCQPLGDLGIQGPTTGWTEFLRPVARGIHIVYIYTHIFSTNELSFWSAKEWNRMRPLALFAFCGSAAFCLCLPG